MVRSLQIQVMTHPQTLPDFEGPPPVTEIGELAHPLPGNSEGRAWFTLLTPQ